MAVYFYKATDKRGKLIEGDLEAADYRTAVQRVRALNYFPIQVLADKPRKSLVSSLTVPGLGLRKRISTKELMSITQQLATLVDSGQTLDRSLAVLVKLTDKPGTREILSDIQKRVHAGSAFADALAEYPEVFSKLFINMIRAGETGGTLGPSLNRLSEFMEKSEEMKGNIRSAMIYPSILTLVGGAAVIVLITVVIPRFATLFDEMGAALPLATRIMLTFSSVISDYWWAFLLGLIGAGGAFMMFIKTEKGRLKWDGFVLRLPLVGMLTRKIEVSRFSRTMSTLLQSGIPILEALLIVRSILSNRVIASAMDNLHRGLKEGEGLSGPLEITGVFPALATHMIAVGEESGALDEMLHRVSETYDKEVERSIRQLISLIEPMMILLMAAIIGFIVISMLLAIFSVNDVSF